MGHGPVARRCEAMSVVLTDLGLFLALIAVWLQLIDSRNEFTIKCLVAGGVFLLAGWVLT